MEEAGVSDQSDNESNRDSDNEFQGYDEEDFEGLQGAEILESQQHCRVFIIDGYPHRINNQSPPESNEQKWYLICSAKSKLLIIH